MDSSSESRNFADEAMAASEHANELARLCREAALAAESFSARCRAAEALAPAPLAPSPVAAIRLLGLLSEEELAETTRNLPKELQRAAVLACEQLRPIAVKLAAQHISEEVRRDVQRLERMHILSSTAPNTGAVIPQVGSPVAADDDPVSPWNSPPADIVASIIGLRGGWEGACLLECVSTTWQAAVLAWRRDIQQVALPWGTRHDDAIRAVARCCPSLQDLEILEVRARANAAKHAAHASRKVAGECSLQA